MTQRLLIAVGLVLCVSLVESLNLLELIRSKPSLSQVTKIIEEDDILKAVLSSGSYTAFLPNDKAMESYTGVRDSLLISYHLSNLPYLIQDFHSELNTDLQGNPAVYITKIPVNSSSTNAWGDHLVYINDAKIIKGNYEGVSTRGMKQFLHIVDRVITPTVPRDVKLEDIDPSYLNPDAQKVILKPRYYGLKDQLSISEFQNRVSSLNVYDIFNISEKNTFFIPVDSALNSLIDKQVIHGHVVPRKVLFTRTVQDSLAEFETMAFTDNLKVLISMENVTSLTPIEEATYYVKSKTVAGDTAHPKGTVLARIIKGNIPVKNGVIHLIDRPLMMVATNIISYLQQEKGQLTMFYDLIRNHNHDLSHKLTVGQHLTVFAPSNKAFNMVNKDTFDEIKLNSDRISKLLRLHIIDRRLTTDEIVDRTNEQFLQVPTLNNGQKLFFDVNDIGKAVPVVTLDGGGVNATVTTPDIAAKNGVIHIIDRILSIPSQTVYEKLATDSMLSDTFQLSEQKQWNERLKNRNEMYTLFVPSNDAWKDIKRQMPSAHKKLFMGKFAYHVAVILERHMIAHQEFTIEDLLNLTTNVTISGNNLQQHRLDMTRGKVYFQASITQSFGEYYVEWNGVRAHVIRPDVKCVNGVVHVINKVLMKNSDVTVSGSVMAAPTGLASLFATFFTVAFARALHH